jgi:stage II sporulation protein GA (sporulation sigma-E factor processing peptidase)
LELRREVKLTVVYLDSFLLINFAFNYLILLASAKLAGEMIHKWRFALAALFGSAYAAFTFFPLLQFFLHPIYKISVALFMILISFGRTRRLLRISAIFLAISCVFCGGIFAIEFLKGKSYMNDGIVYSSLDMKGLLMSAVFCYGIMALFFRRAAMHNVGSGELLKVVFRFNGKTVQLTALQDSGNTLQDPVSGQQILVVEGMRLSSLFPAEWEMSREAMEHPIETMERLALKENGIKFRLLPYRAVGVDCGMLLAVRMDSILVQGESFYNQLVALSPTPVSDGGSYSVLIGCRYVPGKAERVGV